MGESIECEILVVSIDSDNVMIFLLLLYDMTPIGLTDSDSYMLTLVLRFFLFAVPFYVQILTQLSFGMTCLFVLIIVSLYSCLVVPHVYKRSSLRTRTPREFSSVPILVTDGLASSFTCESRS